jgi:hypothetical protein
MVARAVASGTSAPWLEQAAGEVEQRIVEVRRIEAQLAQVGEETAEQDSAARQLRLRLGSAIDALGADESRAYREVERVDVELRAAREKWRAAEAELAPKLHAFAAQRVVDRQLATALLEAGASASRWLEHEALVQAAASALERAQTTQDDLRFQLAQLKGRLAMIAVDHGHAHQKRRDAAAALMHARDHHVDAIHARATALLEHFGRLRGYEEVVRAASMPPERSSR